jgi:ATP-binding cassette subfamily B protein
MRTPQAGVSVGDTSSTGRRVVGLFAMHRRAVGLMVVLVVLASGLNVLIPLLTQVVFDRALFGPDSPDLKLLGLLAAAAVGVAITAGATHLLEAFVSESVAAQILHGLRQRMYQSLQRQPLGFFSEAQGGELQSRLVNDTAQVEESIKETIPSVISTVAGVAFILAAMFYLSDRLLVVTLLLSPIVLWVTARSSRAIRQVATTAQESRARLASLAAERLSLPGIILARVYGRQDEEAASFAAESERLSRLRVRAGMLAQRVMSVAHVFFLVSPYLVFLAVGHLGQVSVGTLAAFTVLQARLYQPLGHLLRISTELRAALGAFDRVFAYVDLPAAPADPLPWPAYRRLGEVKRLRAADLAFAQRGNQTWSLQGVNLDIVAGSAVLVVGPSGSGKTTLGYLLAGLYPPAAGAIHLDDTDTADLGTAAVHRWVRIACQEPFLVHGTIAENLRYGQVGATQQEMERACRMVSIHDRIMALPEGYDSPVGERGALLSGGERQRVALARAVIGDPAVLVLDEATSALDTATELAVVEAVLRHRSRGITLMVSHRMSVMRAFDFIVVLDRGRIVEQGRPDDLAGRPGSYCARMLRAEGARNRG